MEEALIEELKTYSNRPPEEFLKQIVEKLGYTPYLKDAIQDIIKKQANTLPDLARSLVSEMNYLS